MTGPDQGGRSTKYGISLITRENPVGIGGVCPNFIKLNAFLIFENGDGGLSITGSAGQADIWANRLRIDVLGNTEATHMQISTMERSQRQTPRQRRARGRSRGMNKFVRAVLVVLPIPIGLGLWHIIGVQSWAVATLFLSAAAFFFNSAAEK